MVVAKEIDFSQPLASLMKESTREAHEAVESSQGGKLLLSGSLPKAEYVKYLMMLWHVYSTLEQALDKHASHPSLEPTYNPTLLARTPSLSSDIAYLLDVDEESWQAHPLYATFVSAGLPEPLSNYVSRIQHLSERSDDPSPLLAHTYVRYLGDLSGGQTIRHIIAKAYGLDEASGEGIAFYNFKELKSGKLAGLGEMKRIKEWYREGMNKAGETVPTSKPAIVLEASISFRLNAGLFDTLDTSLKDEEDASEAAKRASLKASKGTVVYESTPKQTTYPISSVLAVVAAVCIAHFALVVGGLTGDAGYQKLLAAEEWVATVWRQSTASN